MTTIITFFILHPIYYLIVIALLGLLIGSFLNVVIYRLPRMIEHRWNEECRHYLRLKPQSQTEKLNLALPLSHCPHCKKHIKPWHNIPLLSYLFLRGQCAYCHAPISLRYPLVEVMTAVLSVYVAWRYGVSIATVGALFFTWICVCLTFIDLDTHLLPDELTLLLLWIGLFFSLFHIYCTPQSAIIGAMVGYLIFACTQLIFGLTTGKVGMGQGDFKFLAAFGGFLGWQLLPFIILLASLCGILFAITHMIIKRKFESVPLPFGPYLAVAGWIALLWGPVIVHHYLLYTG